MGGVVRRDINRVDLRVSQKDVGICIPLKSQRFSRPTACGIDIARTEKLVFDRWIGKACLVTRKPLLGNPVFGNPAESDQGISDFVHGKPFSRRYFM